MVRITEELVRKKAEHNECIINSLEELSLHQENVEKIEHLQNWCRELQILYLQANLISKIENLHKLKKLIYLNLAINNIEVIENLQGCESLEKLDLTLNFIGNIESVKSLKHNIFLKDLFLTGNPCCEFPNYRDYVIAVLPQIHNLDVQEISKSERIKAQQKLSEIEQNVKIVQKEYFKYREEQRIRVANNPTKHLSNEEYWKSTSENCPETRVEMALRSKKLHGEGEEEQDKDVKQPKLIKLVNSNGRPLNINQAKLNFTFDDSNPKEYILNLAVYKFLDTNLIKVDLQPIYVTIFVKEKVFQMVFSEEISVEKSTIQRSQTTGHLVLKLPKVNFKEVCFQKKETNTKNCKEKQKENRKMGEYLEVEEKKSIDLSNIVKSEDNLKEEPSDLPPLEYA